MPHPLFRALPAALLLASLPTSAAAGEPVSTTGWQKPDADILKVLHAPGAPQVTPAPGGGHFLLTDPVTFPPLSELAGPMHKLAGFRVNPKLNTIHGRHGGTSPRLVRVEDGTTTSLDLPAQAEVLDMVWTADGERFAMVVTEEDHLGLWLGSVGGEFRQIPGLALNPLLGPAATWLPDQKRLLLRRIPDRGPEPRRPTVPAGPELLESSGASARSTYEARNLLQTAHDDALFDYFMTSEPVLFDPSKDAAAAITVLGPPAPYITVDPSPDGAYFLVERLAKPWSHEVAWWRFAHDVEIWNADGTRLTTLASLPTADSVPTHGVPTGPRSVSWRPTAPHSLVWYEALDGGDPVAEAEFRDRLMMSSAPFTEAPQEIFKAQYRIRPWGNGWGEDGLFLLNQTDRMERRRHIWLLDVDRGTARHWLDLDENDRYGDPGFPVFRTLANGRQVLHQDGNDIYFSGSGATDQGDRPFLDRRNLKTGETRRLFRSPADRYELFVDFAGDGRFVLRSESPTEIPNYYLASLGKKVKAPVGEAVHHLERRPITRFEDPTPEIRSIEKRIVRYERADGVPLSFTLHLPPGYQEGTRLPTVVEAYPLEYSGAAVAGQVRGSAQRFSRFWGASHLYFLLRGYAVLEQTAMPMIGDPETTYDTFVPQLVADAEAAVAKAVEMGVADPERIGIVGHSHGGLMVANLLAHTDLFRAGIARSGSYNKTNQPFGFQSERRSLFEARDAYIELSPTFFADQVDEPVLIIHGADDSNPGTLTSQSEVFFEAVRGSGGTARLVLLPFEDHGYRARESIEHVLWEQLQWFDTHLKNAPSRAVAEVADSEDSNPSRSGK